MPKVNHNRIRQKYSAKPTERERDFHRWVRSMPCLECGSSATLHHVTGHANKIGRAERSHWRVVPLCPIHHQIQHGPKTSVEALSHRGFFDTYGIDLMLEAERLAEAWLQSHGT